MLRVIPASLTHILEELTEGIYHAADKHMS